MKLTDPIFQDANLAREWFEAQRWPNGPICPHCRNSDQSKIAALGVQKDRPEGKGTHGRPGLYKCYVPTCRKQFTVQVGTVMERSHVPLNLWALAMFLMAGAKKGTSARQMARMMGLKSMKTIWFLTHRIREAMKPDRRAVMQPITDARPVNVREYMRIRNGKAQIVKQHSRRRRNWRRYH